MISGITGNLLRLIFPDKCLICGRFFSPPGSGFHVSANPAGAPGSDEKLDSFQYYMAPFLCPECSGDFQPVESPLCPRCGLVFKSREGDDHLCGTCIESPRNYRTAIACGIYNRSLMEVIHCLKYKGKIRLAMPLGSLLFSFFTGHRGWNTVDLVAPVPLDLGRFRKRGFNQSFLMIRDWPEMGLSRGTENFHIQIDRRLLERTRPTTPQTGLDRKMRLENLKDAFRVPDPPKVEGKRILLVDDVYTTGTTVDECSGALMKSGAEFVDVLTMARTI